MKNNSVELLCKKASLPTPAAAVDERKGAL